VLSVEHFIRYDWPEGSLKTVSHAGLASGKAEGLADNTELLIVLLSPVLVPGRVALVEGDELGKLVDLDTDERLIDAEDDIDEEVIDFVTEAEAVEVPSVLLLSPVDVETGVSTSLIVMLGLSTSDDIEVKLIDGVLIGDGVTTIEETTLILLMLLSIEETVNADEDTTDDD
jgi:hypothetical protein